MSKIKVKVLVIDDEKDVGEVLVSLLEYLGHTVTFLHNTKDAPLDRLSIKEDLQKVDIVFSDAKMPDPDGAAIIDLALEVGMKLHCVTIVTGYLDEVLKERIMANGDVRVLKKPFTVVQLEETIVAMLPVTA